MKFQKAYDSGEKWADRYTIIFDNGDAFRMSSDAHMPNGCCYYIGNIKREGSVDQKHITEHIQYKDLPEGTRKQIKYLTY